jgi:probable phosphoglycerate mutase
VELYLVRHGAVESPGGVRAADPPLSAQGRAQAAALAAKLAPVRFDRCLASPLARARETAAELVRGRDLALELHACLAEGSFGQLDGLTTDDARRRHPEFFRLGHSVLARLAATGFTAPGGESRAEFRARAEQARALVGPLLFAADTRALVVAHGGLFAYLIALLMGHEPRNTTNLGFDFCGVARVSAYREEPGFGPFAMLTFVAG